MGIAGLGAVRWSVPYRLDLPEASGAVLDRLIELGALDAEPTPGGGLAALMPDRAGPRQVARALGLARVATSPAIPRDDGSTWVLAPRPVTVGRLRIVPVANPPPRGNDTAADAGLPRTIQLIDGATFGSGLHPTTALCLEAIDDLVPLTRPAAVLDVGTGSGVLALAALRLSVPRALGIDTDVAAIGTAAANARLNACADRLALAHGGPDGVIGTWPLVLANVLAAPLIEMAPMLVRRLASQGLLVLSGIPASVEPDVRRAYQRLGLVHARTRERGGWVAIVLSASW